MKTSPVKRILLKISGEILRGNTPSGIEPKATNEVAKALKGLRQAGLEVAVVIGGGNIFRGLQLKAMGMPRAPADTVGMLATLMNGVALQQALLSLDCPTKLFTGLPCPEVAPSFHLPKALESLKEGQVVVLVGGTGHPYFTTDTAAALRGCELAVDLLVKATKVDGVYTKDPIKDPAATLYPTLTLTQCLNDNLQFMDQTAMALCRANHLPIFVCNMQHFLEGKLPSILSQFKPGTLVQPE